MPPLETDSEWWLELALELSLSEDLLVEEEVEAEASTPNALPLADAEYPKEELLASYLASDISSEEAVSLK